MSKPKLYIKPEDADEFDISEVVSGLEFLGDDENPAPVNTYQQLTGLDGELDVSQTYDKNVINAKFWLHFGDWYDYKLTKHDVFRMLSSRKRLRIRTDAEPAIVKYVRVVPFEIAPVENGAHDALFTVSFDNPSGYKYSLARSDNLYTYDAELWQIGMNLPNGEDLNYHFTTTNFQVYNASDVTIDPYWQHHDLKIICQFSGNSLKLTNTTNSTEWEYQKSATKSDTIIKDGITTTLNGSLASGNTDFGDIILEPGWNEISVTGTTDVDITFSFPFIYLG
ncbi:phage tail protein [Paucilactobacillus hokkaidonensis JCM 18461]|uniref:Phage tail protein n=2 Tax=Paucilactobacillus hokkaidonensis TaxID=1193095 RepID=A0A0A1GUI0_9LACO|nr:phage tail domain-containing protein [Paucilactobacillus hokkaidonensis]KRO09970.1 hypothetical protein IV59_GL000278 [Paucilactobacillus hokkaidonensis]BAP85952.1 phage tail protein [Paucilactobacillus hokkaidonensis JCM 18461]